MVNICEFLKIILFFVGLFSYCFIFGLVEKMVIFSGSYDLICAVIDDCI